jgi:hypothetical protein
MDPIAPLDYERWTVLVNPFPVQVSLPAGSKPGSNDVAPVDGTVSSKPLGYFSKGFEEGRYAHAETGGKKGNSGQLPHAAVSVSPLTSGTTDSIFRILLEEPNK